MTEAKPAPDAAFSFSNLTKVYRVYPSPRDRLFEVLTGRERHSKIHALKGVSASIPRGSVVGVIGENGSGKSTLLKILAGTTPATSGDVYMPGRVAAILELGAAFHPEVTGRRNVILQAALAGLSKSELETALPGIEEFAELGEFFDRPVKTYSSGMLMRLAFSVATAVLPDIVILDEALAVGDGRFQKKCVDRIHELRAAGKTIFFCTHALYYVPTLCDRAMWLRHGEIAGEGDAQSVTLAYEEFLARNERLDAAKAAHVVPADSPGRILAVRVCDGRGAVTDVFQPGQPWVLEVEFEADGPDRALQVHVAIVSASQVTLFVADSRLSGVGPFVGRTRYLVKIRVDGIPLAKGEFFAATFLGDENALALYDARNDAMFRVSSDTWTSGLMTVPVTWDVDQ